jgi:hypothetical protein
MSRKNDDGSFSITSGIAGLGTGKMGLDSKEVALDLLGNVFRKYNTLDFQ